MLVTRRPQVQSVARILMLLEWLTRETKDPGEEFLGPGTALRWAVSRVMHSVQLRCGRGLALARQRQVIMFLESGIWYQQPRHVI